MEGAWSYIWWGLGLIYIGYVIVFFYELYKKCCTRNNDKLEPKPEPPKPKFNLEPEPEPDSEPKG